MVLSPLPTARADVRRSLVSADGALSRERVDPAPSRVLALSPPSGGIFQPYERLAGGLDLGPALARPLAQLAPPLDVVLGLVERLLADLAVVHDAGQAHGALEVEGFGFDASGVFFVRPSVLRPAPVGAPRESDVQAIGGVVGALAGGAPRLKFWFRGTGATESRVAFRDARAARQALLAVIGRGGVDSALKQWLAAVGGRLPGPVGTGGSAARSVAPAPRAEAPVVEAPGASADSARRWVEGELTRLRAEESVRVSQEVREHRGMTDRIKQRVRQSVDPAQLRAAPASLAIAAPAQVVAGPAVVPGAPPPAAVAVVTGPVVTPPADSVRLSIPGIRLARVGAASVAEIVEVVPANAVESWNDAPADDGTEETSLPATAPADEPQVEPAPEPEPEPEAVDAPEAAEPEAVEAPAAYASEPAQAESPTPAHVVDEPADVEAGAAPAEAEVEPQSAPEVEPQSAPEVEPQSAPEVEPQSAPDVEPQSAPEVEPQSAPEVEPQSIPEPIDLPIPPSAVLVDPPAVEPAPAEPAPPEPAPPEPAPPEPAPPEPPLPEPPLPEPAFPGPADRAQPASAEPWASLVGLPPALPLAGSAASLPPLRPASEPAPPVADAPRAAVVQRWAPAAPPVTGADTPLRAPFLAAPPPPSPAAPSPVAAPASAPPVDSTHRGLPASGPVATEPTPRDIRWLLPEEGTEVRLTRPGEDDLEDGVVEPSSVLPALGLATGPAAAIVDRVDREALLAARRATTQPTPPRAPEPARGPVLTPHPDGIEEPGDVFVRPAGVDSGPAWGGAVGVTQNSDRGHEKGPGKWTESGRDAEELASHLPAGPSRPLRLDDPAPSAGMGWVVVGIVALLVIVAAVAFWPS